jgi:hypothetical protein
MDVLGAWRSSLDGESVIHFKRGDEDGGYDTTNTDA